MRRANLAREAEDVMKNASANRPCLDCEHSGVDRLRTYAHGFQARTVILFTLTA